MSLSWTVLVWRSRINVLLVGNMYCTTYYVRIWPFAAKRASRILPPLLNTNNKNKNNQKQQAAEDEGEDFESYAMTMMPHEKYELERNSVFFFHLEFTALHKDEWMCDTKREQKKQKDSEHRAMANSWLPGWLAVRSNAVKQFNRIKREPKRKAQYFYALRFPFLLLAAVLSESVCSLFVHCTLAARSHLIQCAEIKKIFCVLLLVSFWKEIYFILISLFYFIWRK